MKAAHVRSRNQRPISLPAAAAAVGSPSKRAAPKCLPRTLTCSTSLVPRAATIAIASAGKHAWSPVISINSVGTWIAGAQRMNPARLLNPDQVDNHASGVVNRPKPTTP